LNDVPPLYIFFVKAALALLKAGWHILQSVEDSTLDIGKPAVQAYIAR